MPCVMLCFKAVCCSLCPICSAASMALTLRQTLSTTAGCRICRRKDAWHFMALGKSMLMCMPELAFLLVPEATCNNTEAGTANAISTTFSSWEPSRFGTQKVVRPTTFAPDLAFFLQCRHQTVAYSARCWSPCFVPHCLYALCSRDVGHK